MKNTSNPNFILGIISIIIVFIGIALKVYSYSSGDAVLIAGAVLGGIHWVWSIIHVFGDRNVSDKYRILWIIAVVAAPYIGSLLYYMLKYRRITT